MEDELLRAVTHLHLEIEGVKQTLRFLRTDTAAIRLAVTEAHDRDHDLSPEDLATRMAVSRDTVYRWIAEGTIAATRTPDRRLSISQAEAERFRTERIRTERSNGSE